MSRKKFNISCLLILFTQYIVLAIKFNYIISYRINKLKSSKTSAVGSITTSADKMNSMGFENSFIFTSYYKDAIPIDLKRSNLQNLGAFHM